MHRHRNEIIQKKDCQNEILQRYTESSLDRKQPRQRLPSDFTERFPLMDPDLNQFSMLDTTKLCSHKHF